MSGFSSGLQLTDLDDFITPSQECVKPALVKPTASRTGAKITIDDSDSYLESNVGGYGIQKLEKVAITLSDCLACSGCITSAESVLVTQQSEEELLRVFNENKRNRELGNVDDVLFIVISVSIQPLLSLAVRYNLSPEECATRLSGYFKYLGADMIVDMAVADDLAVEENKREFVRRLRATQQDGAKNLLPMLASSCPGWVCYAEKTHGSYILPYIAQTKSPQQIMGSLIKTFINSGGRRIYHITVMPCYDKKLEAAREDFVNKDTERRDIDCVITAIELEQMLTKSEKTLSDFQPELYSQPWLKNEVDFIPKLSRHIGSASGGYSDQIFIYAAKEMYQVECADLKYCNLRNPDFKEVLLESDDKILLRFAIANGFRNIQNLVQKLKRGKSQYSYVEVMACPSGCLNGGAQVRPVDKTQSKEINNELDNMFKNLPVRSSDNKVTDYLYKCWLDGVESDKCYSLLHTSYHEVAKINTVLNIKW